MTSIVLTCISQIVIGTIIIGLLSRRYFARIISERRAKRQEASAAVCEAATEARKVLDKEIYLSALSGRLMEINEANRGNRDRTALVALSEICRRLNDGRDVPEHMILHVLSKLKGTEGIIAQIQAAK